MVYNHLGPSDLDLWQFDGWSQGDKGGIYFYQDERSSTPWGETRPDYGRADVREFLRDNVLQWLDEFRVDGLRWDATAYISSITGGGHTAADVIEDGWDLMAAITSEMAERYPGRLFIAEDLKGDAAVTLPTDEGGAGFGAQWDGGFVFPVRAALTATADEERDVAAVAAAIGVDAADAFRRIIYTESHDEDANGSARVPEEIWPGYADSWASKKRATLGSALVLTSPGIPMLFQGQELIEGSWFADDDPLDWSLRHRHKGPPGAPSGPRPAATQRRRHDPRPAGPNVRVHHVDDSRQGHRVAPLGGRRPARRCHRPGQLLVRDATRAIGSACRGPAAGGSGSTPTGTATTRTSRRCHALDADADDEPADGMDHSISVGVGPYTAIILSQDD